MTRPSGFPLLLPIIIMCGAIGAVLALVAANAALAASPPARSSPTGRVLVVCSPGSPGDTAEAQPTMDSFARAAERSSRWPQGSLEAVYFETAEAGLARLERPDAALAIVPPSFLSKYGKELSLKPRMEAILASGKPESWSLVAKKGKITSPDSLKGWEVTGAPGFAPEFVRGELLKEWGVLPADSRVTFTPRVLTALQRASEGEEVAILLDSAGTEALSSLPFAADLEIVARSRTSPAAFLCTVGNRLPAAEADALVRGLSHLGGKEGGAEVLKSMRLSRFVPIKRATPHGTPASHERPPQAAGH
jgi:hypothetical protein